MIVSMPTTARPQQRYDHRLRDLVQRTGDVTVATDLGVPRSTARGWLGGAPTVVVCLDVVDLTEPELRQEVLKLRRRVQSYRRCSGSRWPCYEHPGFVSQESAYRTDAPRRGSCAPWIGPASISPLPSVLQFLCVSPRRFNAWRRRQRACALDDQSSCPRTSPTRLTPAEVRGDRGDGHIARLSSRPDRHTRRPRPATRQGLGLALHLVPPRPAERLAPPPAPVAVGTALTGGPPHGSVRAALLHTALTLDEGGEPLFGPGMENAGRG